MVYCMGLLSTGSGAQEAWNQTPKPEPHFAESISLFFDQQINLQLFWLLMTNLSHSSIKKKDNGL